MEKMIKSKEILCPYCRSKISVKLPNYGIEIIDCPFCNRRIKIMQNRNRIVLYPNLKENFKRF